MPCPPFERTARGTGKTEIGSPFREGVAQGRRWRHTHRYRERKAVCLPDAVVRVLTQDHSSDRGEWRQAQSGEDV